MLNHEEQEIEFASQGGKQLGRRTSLALGHSYSSLGRSQRLMERKEMKRQKLREAMVERIKSGKGLNAAAGQLAGGDGIEKLFNIMDIDRSGSISFKEFKKTIDKLGFSLMHQDGKDLMEQIDTDGSGDISLSELRQFLEGDHREMKKQADINRENARQCSVFP